MGLRFFSLIVSSALAAHPAKPDMAAVEKVLAHLRTGEGFHSGLVKKVHSGQLGSDSESDGEIYFAKGKMRMEFAKPEKTLLVFDGEQAWQEQEFDDGESKHAIVTKMKNIKHDNALLAAILGEKDALKNFTIVSSEEKKNILHVELKPKNTKNADVTLLRLDIDGANLKAMSYLDSLENEVSFSFDDMKEEKISKKKFEYTPPKGAEETDL